MRRFLFLLLISCAFFSCKKEYSYEGGTHTPPPPTGPEREISNNYYIRLRFDGGPFQLYNFDATAYTSTGMAADTLIFKAYATADGNNLEGITLAIAYTTITPTLGDYREDYSGSDYLISGYYNPNSTTSVYAAGYGHVSAEPLTITINYISNTEITGIFTGNFYRSDVVNGEVGTTYDDFIFIEGTFILPL